MSLVDRIKPQPSPSQGRGYIGCSVIGHPCDRFIWNELKGIPKQPVSFEQNRLFERGFWEEERLTALLKKKEIPIVGQQTEVQSEWMKGHVDFIINQDDQNLLVEVKTTNDRSWNEIKKRGVYYTKLSWYIQMQCYLHLLNLDEGLFWVVNRNTEAIYEERTLIHSEIYRAAETKAHRIAGISSQPLGLGCNLKPERECFGCAYQNQCWPQSACPDSHSGSIASSENQTV